ncbi:hypothetical protein NECAME_05829 [Necator americanus]|uniref:Uncharacterized protein n=1 Tax=Necator americanus TaxID=51031 RepID=W2U0L3_NECAM|nr:hypothetical protein NECAME_05829 [Necator americanus]ETN86837.1 hypothetical protein NECAME_05829 [Necator americanus]
MKLCSDGQHRTLNRSVLRRPTAKIANMEAMLVTLENLITVHFSTSESSPTDKVTPRRRRATSCRPQCVCSKLKTSYA